MTDFQPRPGQRQALAYCGGKMGISAVPGSGKTHTLAALAAQLVADAVADGQEVLIVTLVNSAVDNFKLRINQMIAKRRLLTNYGYRVRTLHGLAHDIGIQRLYGVGNKIASEADKAFIAERLPEFHILGFLPADPLAIEADQRGRSVFDLAPRLAAEARAIVDRLASM